MPRGNRTGPTEMGPMTGRGLGHCGGSDVQGTAGGGRARGTGFGRSGGFWAGCFGGGGRGWRHRFYATGLPGWMRLGGSEAPDPELEKQALTEQAQSLQSALDEVKKRLDALQSGPGVP